MKSQNIFVGRFRLVCLHYYVEGRGWVLFERFPNESLAWEFTQEGSSEFESGGVSYRGILAEYSYGALETATGYSYHTQDRMFYIDRSDYAPDGFCNMCVNDRYRVERIGENEYWLYDLEDVEHEPQDYKIRLRIAR